MAEEAPVSTQPAKGGALRLIIIIVILILLSGVGVAWFLMRPTPPPVLKAIVWPGEEEKALQLTATLSDGSYHLLTELRMETATHGHEVEEEFKGKRSVILGIMTEVANSLDQTTVHKIKEFKSRLLRRLNDVIQTADIEDVAVENWLVQPAE